MFKVMVVIYGLVMLVPGGGENDLLTVVVLDTPAGPMRHQPELRQISPRSGPARHDLGEPFDFVLTAPSGSGNLDALDEFIAIETLVDPESDGRIRRECGGAGGECVDDAGKALVAGFFRFQGPWDARAASYCGRWVTPIRDYDDAELDFRTTGWDVHPTADRQLATVLVLETTVESEMELDQLVERLQPNAGFLDLSPTRSGPCGNWLPGGEESCVVLIAGNPARQPTRCPDCRLDRHFSGFYDLVVGKLDDEERYLPYVKLGDPGCLGRGFRALWNKLVVNDPSPRCPPPVGQLAPTVTASPPAPPPPD